MALVDLKSDLAKNAGKNFSKISGRLNDPSLSDKQGRSSSTQPQFENKSKNAKQFRLDIDKTQNIYFKDGSFQSDIERNQIKGIEAYYKRALSDKDRLGMRRIGAQGNSLNQPYIIREIGERWNSSNAPQIGNTVDFTAKIFNAAAGLGNSVGIAVTVAIPQYSSVVIISKENALYLEENRSIGVQRGIIGDADVICSYEEIS